MATKLFKNITDKKIKLPVTANTHTDDEVPAGETISITSEWIQPLSVPGLVDITDLSADEQKDAIAKAKKDLEANK